MALNKYKIGQLAKIVDERNDIGIREFYGININKEFMPTAADTTGLDEKKYKIIRNNRFVYSGMQTGRDKCIRIGLYMEDTPIIVSPAYTTFEIIREDIVLPEYFFMKFLSKEKDRLGWFYSDSSVRSNLDWDRFCDIELDLPNIDIQKKYVDIYKSMFKNQKCYERGLEDLKLTCDAYIEEIRRKNECVEIENYIQRYDEKNRDNKIKIVKGVSVTKELRDPTSKVNKDELRGYKIVHPGDITFVQTTHNEKVFANAINNINEDIVVTSVNEVFKTDNEKLIPEYLTLFFNRTEFDRYARYHSWGSARETFTWNDLIKVKIPIPELQKQQDIVNIYKVYILRKGINEKLKEQIKNICPILIKGSLEEAKSN